MTLHARRAVHVAARAVCDTCDAHGRQRDTLDARLAVLDLCRALDAADEPSGSSGRPLPVPMEPR